MSLPPHAWCNITLQMLCLLDVCWAGSSGLCGSRFLTPSSLALSCYILCTSHCVDQHDVLELLFLSFLIRSRRNVCEDVYQNNKKLILRKCRRKITEFADKSNFCFIMKWYLAWDQVHIITGYGNSVSENRKQQRYLCRNWKLENVCSQNLRESRRSGGEAERVF